MFTRVTDPSYLARNVTESFAGRAMAWKSGARVSTPTTPPSSVRVRMNAPAPMARTIPPTSSHCFDISGLHGAGAPECADRPGDVGLSEHRLARDEGIGADHPRRLDSGGIDPAVDLQERRRAPEGQEVPRP